MRGGEERRGEGREGEGRGGEGEGRRESDIHFVIMGQSILNFLFDISLLVLCLT